MCQIHPPLPPTPAHQHILLRRLFNLFVFIDTPRTIAILIFNNKFYNDFQANYFVIIGWRKIQRFVQIESHIINKIIMSTLNRTVIAKKRLCIHFSLSIRTGPRIGCIFFCFYVNTIGNIERLWTENSAVIRFRLITRYEVVAFGE